MPRGRPPKSKPLESPHTEESDWWAYIQGGREDENIRNALIVRYLPLLEVEAHKIAKRTPGNIEFDDLFNAGVFGLVDTIRRFDPAYGYRFWTFACRRVVGTMLDWVRQQDEVSRIMRKRMAAVARATERLTYELGRTPTTEEIQVASGLSNSEWELASRPPDRSGSQVMMSSEYGKETTLLDIVATYREMPELEREDTFRALTRPLGIRDQTILYLHYHCEATLKEIGAILRCSESRVSQRRTEALALLRNEKAVKRIASEANVA